MIQKGIVGSKIQKQSLLVPYSSHGLNHGGHQQFTTLPTTILWFIISWRLQVIIWLDSQGHQEVIQNLHFLETQNC